MPWVSKPGAVRFWRERACLTVPELAKRAGVSERTVYALEADKPHASQLATFKLIVEALKKAGCSMDAIAVHVDDDKSASAAVMPHTVDDASAPELGTLSRRAQRERRLGMHQQVVRSGSETFELLGLDRFKKCLSRPAAYNGRRFVVHGTVDEYMGIPPAARRVLDCVDGGKFRVVRHVEPDLLHYTTIFAVTSEHANRLDRALDGEPVDVIVRLVHSPASREWPGFYWFEKSPKPREFAFVVERFLDRAELLKELPSKGSEKRS